MKSPIDSKPANDEAAKPAISFASEMLTHSEREQLRLKASEAHAFGRKAFSHINRQTKI